MQKSCLRLSVNLLSLYLSSFHHPKEYLYLKLFFLWLWLFTRFLPNYFLTFLFPSVLSPCPHSCLWRELLMCSLQVSRCTDILLFCHSAPFQHLPNALYFQERAQKIPFMFQQRTWTPFPTSNPLQKVLQSEALIFPHPKRYEVLQENPQWRYAGGRCNQESRAGTILSILSQRHASLHYQHCLI